MKSVKEQFDEMICMESVKQVISSLNPGTSDTQTEKQYLTVSRLQQDMPCPEKKTEMLNFVITGNPGIGKTSLARLIAQHYLETGHVVRTFPGALISGYTGQVSGRITEKVMQAM